MCTMRKTNSIPTNPKYTRRPHLSHRSPLLNKLEQYWKAVPSWNGNYPSGQRYPLGSTNQGSGKDITSQDQGESLLCRTSSVLLCCQITWGRA